MAGTDGGARTFGCFTDGGPRGRVTAVAPRRIWRGLSAAALGHACGHEGPLRRRGSVFGVSGAVHAG